MIKSHLYYLTAERQSFPGVGLRNGRFVGTHLAAKKVVVVEPIFEQTFITNIRINIITNIRTSR